MRKWRAEIEQLTREGEQNERLAKRAKLAKARLEKGQAARKEREAERQRQKEEEERKEKEEEARKRERQKRHNELNKKKLAEYHAQQGNVPPAGAPARWRQFLG